jgi:hypothetical protein
MLKHVKLYLEILRKFRHDYASLWVSFQNSQKDGLIPKNYFVKKFFDEVTQHRDRIFMTSLNI